MENKIFKNRTGVKLLLRTFKHVITRDEKYIRKMSEFDENSDYIEVCHNGKIDYGKIVYVIRENTGYDGFCATAIYVLYFLLFAKEHCFAPVIKMSRDFAYFDEEKSKEIANPWEYYFEIPNDCPDDTKALNVSHCNYHQRDLMRNRYDLNPYKTENYFDSKVVELACPLISKYMRLKPEIINDSASVLECVTGRGGKVLGVHFRGTDYKRGFDKHPVYVDETQTIDEIRNAMDTGKFDAVFIASDDADIYESIKAVMPDVLLLMHKDVYRSSGSESVAFSKCARKYHKYLLGYEIARDMYTLSLCDGLVAGKSSVCFMSNLYKHSRNEKYEYMHIIDNGNNSNDNAYFKES